MKYNYITAHPNSELGKCFGGDLSCNFGHKDYVYVGMIRREHTTVPWVGKDIWLLVLRKRTWLDRLIGH